MTIKETRQQILQRIDRENWDIIVIGGGITGAGILREATRRNLKALMLEQRDFAWGTSSRSTKMVHGGLRYLKEGNFALTRESVLERENLIAEFPGLVDNKGFILPFYRGKILQRLIIYIGLVIYDLLSKKWRKHVCSANEMNTMAPVIGKKDLRGGFYINDAITDDARLVFRVLSEALRTGATALNYCRVESLLKKNGQVKGVVCKDMESNTSLELKAKLVINATGAWADLLRKEIKKTNKKKIRPLRGSHLILSRKKLPLVKNISMIHPQDKRPVIVLVWEGRVLIGTTDIDHSGDLNREAFISSDEAKYLLEALQYSFPDLNLTRKDIIATQAGVRPVIDTGKENPSQESRDHVIWQEDGLLTVTGGKMTTFRIIALDALKSAQKITGPLKDLNKKQSIITEKIASLPTPPGMSEKTLTRLKGRYGNLADDLIKNARNNELDRIQDIDTIWAELRWAAENEMVVHLEDLMLRRSRLGLLFRNGAKELLPHVRSICQTALNWDDEKWKKEEADYLRLWQKHYAIPEF